MWRRDVEYLPSKSGRYSRHSADIKRLREKDTILWNMSKRHLSMIIKRGLLGRIENYVENAVVLLCD